MASRFNSLLGLEWMSCRFSTGALDDLMEDAMSQILYHTPFDYR